MKTVIEYDELQNQLINEREHKLYLETYISEQIRRICYILTTHGYINEIQVENSPESDYELTPLGKVAASIAEIHPLIFSKMLVTTDYFQNFTSKQLIGLFSCFTDVKVKEELRIVSPDLIDSWLQNILEKTESLFEMIQDMEYTEGMDTGIKYNNIVTYDLLDYMQEWCNCTTEQECKYFMQKIMTEKGISVGDFTKAVLKIATIAKELISVMEKNNLPQFTHKLVKIEPMILKYITTPQSLYV
jgi:ribosomal protein S8